MVHRRRRLRSTAPRRWRSASASVGYAVRVYLVRDGAEANKHAMALFGFSILYLFALFGLLVVEHGFGLIGAVGAVNAVADHPGGDR